VVARRVIAVATVARSDFGLYEPLLGRIRAEPALELRLMPSGAHFSPEFGRTISEIEAGGFPYEPGLEMRVDSGSRESLAKSLGLGVLAFAQAFARSRPDLLVVLGDRLEMLCSAVASLPYGVPIAHLYGGKISEGAVDELVRHALTKMAHLHFVATAQQGRRVRQMGEEAWRVHVVGSPGLDRLRDYPRAGRAQACAELGIDPARPFLLVTYHPVTLELEHLEEQVAALLEALGRFGGNQVLTYPNADVGYQTIIRAFEAYRAGSPDRVTLVRNVGARRYFDLMAHAAAIVGNSSSGIAEAPSFGLPAVNIGTRQAGFERAANVIDSGYDAGEILAALRRATAPEFRASLAGLKNPYGEGDSSARVVEVLREVALDDRLMRKKFVDITEPW
jgi:UDP-N-acetylglucosamine 2-epimerase (non-hydrolysing)/GDP/UDP-N,N'-diacetylbacillosamine 2-epimerase (hydrolysing)